VEITETNRLLAEQFNEAFNRGDIDAAASCFAEELGISYPLTVRHCGIRRRVGMRVHAQSSELRVRIHQTPTSPRNNGKWFETRVDFASAWPGRAQAEE
jgi:hypothetical protein